MKERQKEGWGGREEKRGSMGQIRNPAVWCEQKLSLLRAQFTTVRSLEGEKTIITDLSVSQESEQILCQQLI